MSPVRSAFVLAVLVLASACAADGPQRRADRGPPRGEDDGGPPGRPGPRATLFISPSGEPFRGKPGEPYPVAAWFAQADANKDGRLDRAEFIADAERFFHRLDVDGDGTIDGAELQTYEQRIAPEIIGAPGPVGQVRDSASIIKVSDIILVQMGGGGGGGGGKRGGRNGNGDSGQKPASPTGPTVDDSALKGAAPYGLLAEPEPVAASDLSFAGRIGLADFRRRAGQRFDKLDVDQKGFLTLAGLPKTAAQTRTGAPRQGRRPQRSPTS